MRFHHVGVVVKSIEHTANHYRQNLHLEPRSEIIEDPIQKVNVQFWGRPGDATSVELIEPLGEDSPVQKALFKGGGLNHLCYEVDDIMSALEEALANGALQVGALAPATAFGGRRITFLYYRHIGLIELVEAEAAPC
jgi:methylmalonyl-CoA/ethylmalonyl-CoA epimerase